MLIFQDTHRCTLGYTASNAHGDRLAVTAGHCGRPGEPVYDKSRQKIGHYIAVQPDDLRHRNYGYSLIRIHSGIRLSPWITPTFAIERQATPHTGDYVCAFGTTSGMKCSTVTNTSPAAGTLDGSLTAGGDSGGPVIRMKDHALVGIIIAHNPERAQTQFEPITNITARTAHAAAAGQAFAPIVHTDA
ncbi:hypothetical protein C1Y40_04589 [Mycobacterium talmoniae]|uniref:Peptidase S1 domain-containing protein n=1 Tax=Mycobacterium talmoniae TaxID=1858794 RepID=A0A2S8BF65_9MYCO|nr:hypothetical protein C1Y40_04589 [Mycobacterium talmoniae]